MGGRICLLVVVLVVVSIVVDVWTDGPARRKAARLEAVASLQASASKAGHSVKRLILGR